MRFKVLLLVTVALSAAADEISDAKKRWSESPHGPLLERILPPTFEPAQLPEPGSAGAQLTLRYCVQCHNLPNPAMHHAAKWRPTVDRMVKRMQGRGNLGVLMSEMMAGVKAPSPDETRALVAYLRKHAQKPLDPKRYPALDQPAGEAFRIACSQCHALPDPKRHTAEEWRAVVERMQENMQWMNRVVASQPASGEPQLRIDEINAFLAKYARKRPDASTGPRD
jgi:cytochrome c5